MSVPARVMVVDDHPVFRAGLGRVLEGAADLEVCAESSDAERALGVVEDAAPDVMLVDLALPGMSGIDLIRELRRRYQGLPILVVSMHDEALFAERALRAGANGYVMKQAPPERLLLAIRQVLSGEIGVSRQVSQRALLRFSGSESGPEERPLDRLTDREMEVFLLIGQGVRTRDIAERLSISAKTVEAHRSHIKGKLGMRDGHALTRAAIAWATDLSGDDSHR